MKAVEKLRVYNRKDRLSYERFLNKIDMGGFTLNDIWEEPLTEHSAPELCRAYALLCDAANLPLEKRVPLMMLNTREDGFGEYVEETNRIYIYSYAYSLLSVGALVSMMAHELGHHNNLRYIRRQRNLACADPVNYIAEHTGWNRAKIRHEAHKIVQELLSKHSGREDRPCLDAKQIELKYLSAYRKIAYRLVSALDEIEADAFAQKILGADWAGQFIKEINHCAESGLPTFLYLECKAVNAGPTKSQFNKMHDMPWFMETTYISNLERLKFIRDLGPISRRVEQDNLSWEERGRKKPTLFENGVSHCR